MRTQLRNVNWPMDYSPGNEYELDPYLGPKPAGGLWTSTYRPPPARYASDWIGFVLRDGMLDTTECDLLEIDPAAEIFTIDSTEDAEALLGRFPGEHEILYGINWPAVSKEYDAVHMTRKGVLRNRDSNLPQNRMVVGWDVESTCFFRAVFTSVEPYEGPVVREK